MAKSKAHGQRGSWFAKAEGETLPCVHAHWWKGQRYHDIHARPGDSRFAELLQGIKATGRVVLTTDAASDDARHFKRTGYIAVYAVEDVSLDDEGLRFRFTHRLIDLT